VVTSICGHRSFGILNFSLRGVSVSNDISLFELIQRLFILLFEELSTVIGRISIDLFRRKGKRIFSEIDYMTIFLFIFLVG
jgi:hypothetical protein